VVSNDVAATTPSRRRHSRSLLKRTRQQLHARIGEVLETRFPERVESEPEVIARHYEQAGLVARAIAH
jgi:predicted ATPase